MEFYNAKYTGYASNSFSLILAAIAIVLSFLPLISHDVYYWLYIKYTSPEWYGFNTSICSGLLLLIAGLLDHWQMVRMFARVRGNLQASSYDTQE